MKRFSIKNVIAYLIPSVLFLGMLMWVYIALNNTSLAAERSERAAVKTTIENGITMCYAIEGAYPPNLTYLKDNYGVFYDTEKYTVHYESFADNIRPTVRVLERRS